MKDFKKTQSNNDIHELVIAYNCLFESTEEPIKELNIRAGNQYIRINVLESFDDSKVHNTSVFISFSDLNNIKINTSDRIINDECYSRFYIETKNDRFSFYYPETEDNDFFDAVSELEHLILSSGS